MKPRTQKAIALLIGSPAAVVMIASIGLLITGYVSACYRAPLDTQRIEVLEQAVSEDAARTPELTAELERQTETSLSQSASNQQRARLLIVAAILFLACAKWLIALDGRRPPELARIMTQHRLGTPRVQKSCCEPRVIAHAGRPLEPCDGPEIDLTFTDDAIAQNGRNREAVIPILQAIQSHYRYLPDAALARICEQTHITAAQITSVSSFYKRFRRSPMGRHVVRVCRGTACHVAGAEIITDEIRRQLGIDPGDDTDPAQQFTIEEVACLGCCTLAPVVQVDGVTHGHLTADAVPELLGEALAATGNGKDAQGNHRTIVTGEGHQACGEFRIGLGSCCVAGGSGKVYEALEQAVAATGAGVTVKRVGCVGMCHQTPLVEAVFPGRAPVLYPGVSPEDARTIVQWHVQPVGFKRRITRTVSTLFDVMRHDGIRRDNRCHAIEVRDPPVAEFLGPQKHIATEHCGHLDPTDLDEYLRHDGFIALEQCLKDLSPQEIIGEIQRSGLRGRGGAGYPTGRKWSKVRDASGEEKYIVCNGDEGDPGAFMDRMLMESFPYRIIEGAAIAAYSVGASEGCFYVRQEYPLAVRRLRQALRECEERGFLGEHILGTDTSLRLRVIEGAGAFVCGEETALLASLEGDRGSPTLRPPYPAERGLRGKPTLVGNVETYANVPWILRHGADAFAAMGTATSKGTKVFALAGKIKRGGLIEVPMGVTIREVVEEIGGGIKGDRAFKAVQIGGPSGGCVPAMLADTPVDYEALSEVGAMMGSGGLVVLDESDCVVDIARYMLSFTQDQSCGKCTHCRIGTRRMLDILDRLCEGRGTERDLQTLEQLSHMVRHGSLCGLGRTAPNPVLTTLRYFRDEYEAHLHGRCPAGRCKALIRYRVTDACVGCTLCAQHCGAEAIRYAPYEKHEINDEKCTRCDICRLKCPEDAITVE